MENFFPHGFWPSVVMMGMALFLVFGLDLIFFKARMVSGLSQYMNKSFHVDQMVIRMLESLKRASDREFDTEPSLLRGWGRSVCGVALIGAAFLLFNLLPSLK